MRQGVFTSLSSSYFQAAKNVYFFVGEVSWLVKPFALIFAMGFSAALFPVGLVFWVLIFLDHLGSTTDTIRMSIIHAMEEHSWRISDSFGAFLFRPVILVFISPLFIASLAIPKVSSSAWVNLAEEEVKNIISGSGAFKRINTILWSATSRLFIYVSNAPLLIKPVAAMIAVVYSLVLIGLGAIFIFFIPLDWISQMIESIRQGVVRFVESKKEQIKYDGGAFLFAPALLVILSPVFLAAILVPKFGTQLFDINVT